MDSAIRPPGALSLGPWGAQHLPVPCPFLLDREKVTLNGPESVRSAQALSDMVQAGRLENQDCTDFRPFDPSVPTQLPTHDLPLLHLRA